MLTLKKLNAIISPLIKIKENKMIFKGYLFSILYGVACLLLSLIVYKLGLPKKYARKLVHILVGFEWVILYRFFGAGLHFLVVCIFFTVLLAISHFKKLMPMISSDGDNAPGTVYYGVAMTGVAIVGCFLPNIMLPFGIGILCTSVGDGFAGVVGQLIKKYNPKIFGNKSLFGTVANFAFSFFGAWILSSIYSMDLELWHCLLIAILSVELELFTGFGLDNISITWGITALAYGFIYFNQITNYLVPILLSPLIIAFAHKKKALTKQGIALAILMDVVISVSLGNFGFLCLVAFFVGSLIIDKFKNRYKSQGRIDAVKQDSCRSTMQVFANGGVGMILSFLLLFFDTRAFIVAFTASFAEAFADTAASGIGIFAKKTYDPFRMRVCEKGLSGGMSVVGTLSSFAAAFALSALGLAFDLLTVKEWLIASLCASAGAVFDSMLGSLVQVKYECTECGSVTEKKIHCDTETEHYSGVRWINNNFVNLFSVVFSAAFAILFTYVI